MHGLDLGFVSILAATVRTPEDAMRLIVSLASAYPLSFIYRLVIQHQSINLRHFYFIFIGLFVCVFNFGVYSAHSLVNISVIYVMLMFLQGTKASVVFAFGFNTVYLVTGYTTTMTGTYGVRWTTAHCVLCLRLIGLTMDLYDGRKKTESLSPDQKESCLRRLPSLTEVMAHTYFYGSFLIGPQFSMKRYLDFVSGAYNDSAGGIRSGSKRYTVQRLLAGVVYTAIYQICHSWVANDTMIANVFLTDYSFLQRCGFILIWGKLQLCKYLGVWLLTEGACVLTGISYNGADKDGNNKWDACANVRIIHYEKAEKCHQVVESFNVNTNKWMAMYLFKRLRWLGNRTLSHIITLIYLALWHGIYSGYFMCFVLEFLIINFEKQMEELYHHTPALHRLYSTNWSSWVMWFFQKIYTQFVLSYSLVAFCLFTYDRYMPAYQSVFYIVHIFFILWGMTFPFFKTFFVPKVEIEKKMNSGKKRL